MIDAQDVILAELTRELVERFAPERIILFGSRARGDHRPDSDYDLMMVLGESEHSEIAVRLAVQEIRTNVEMFVDTCERFERRRTDVGTLGYAIDREGRILYSRAAASKPRRVRETPGTSPESLDEWIDRAHNDFVAMTELSRSTSAVRDAIVFHAHQAVEKMLKAVLVARRMPPPRTHERPQLVTELPSEVATTLSWRRRVAVFRLSGQVRAIRVSPCRPAGRSTRRSRGRGACMRS